MGSAAGPHPARRPPAKQTICWEKTLPVAVKIKLKRLGKIRAPYYRIVVADARTKRDGRAIEEIGKYHPKAEPSFIEVDSDRAQHWLSVGAQPTDPVRKLLEITGDWQKFKGLPGTEGTLKTAAPKESRKDIFAAAVKETLEDGGGAPKGRSRSAASKDADAAKGGKPPAKDASPGKGDRPAKGRSGDGKGGGARGGSPKAAQAAAGEPAEAQAPAEPAASDPAASGPAASDPAASDPAASDPAASGPAAAAGGSESASEG
jgi:small subunit ribosomal protein S16